MNSHTTISARPPDTPVARAGGPVLHRLETTAGTGAVLLLSDLHLDHMSPGKAEHLARLLDVNFSNARDIFLMGDIATSLHDAVVQTRTEARASAVLSALRRHGERGTAIWLLPGNHDRSFHEAGGDWPAFSAERVATVPMIVERFGKRLRISHGDEHDPAAVGRLEPLMRLAERHASVLAVLRCLFGVEHRVWRVLGWAAPAVEKRQPHAAELLSWLASAAAHPPDTFLFAAARWERIAESLLAAGAGELVAMGHTHVSRLHAYAGGIYVNTGDWLEHAVVTWLDAEGVHQQDLVWETSCRTVRWRADC